MRYTILEREKTMLLFDRENTINPSSSLQIMQVGDRGMVHSLNGPGFYKLLEGGGLRPFEEMGLRSVYAAVSNPHLSLMRTMLHHRVEIDVQGECLIDRHALNWVLLSKPS